MTGTTASSVTPAVKSYKEFTAPKTQTVTSLTLHPLMIMDCTLTEKKYMNLPEKEAINISRQIIKNCKQHGGDLCLLWHNQSVEKENLHRHIIKQILA